MRSATMRASVSVGPPAANGTTIVTGRVGKPASSAAAGPAALNVTTQTLAHSARRKNTLAACLVDGIVLLRRGTTLPFRAYKPFRAAAQAGIAALLRAGYPKVHN